MYILPSIEQEGRGEKVWLSPICEWKTLVTILYPFFRQTAPNAAHGRLTPPDRMMSQGYEVHGVEREMPRKADCCTNDARLTLDQLLYSVLSSEAQR